MPRHPYLIAIRRLAYAALRNGAVYEHRTTIKEFLAGFDVSQRREQIVRRICGLLKDHGLRTVPDFTKGSLRNPIVVKLAPDRALPMRLAMGSPRDPVLRLAAAASMTLETVDPNDNLDTAKSRMILNDFSQLPVMQKNDRHARGIVSWESIGRSGADDDGTPVRDCMSLDFSAKDADAPLLDAVDDILKYGCILVERRGRVMGIVTLSDLVQQLTERTAPFLLVQEIEEWLRHLEFGKFSTTELSEARGDAEPKDMVLPTDLAFGHHLRLIGSRKRWSRLDLRIRREELIGKLDDVREVRNEVMHFKRSRIKPADLRLLKGLARYLRGIDRSRRRS